jgi:hypothetical protein
LNGDQEIDFDLVCRVISELELRRIMSVMLRGTQDKALLERRSRHHLDLSFIDRFGKRTVEFDPERLWRHRRKIGLPLRCRLVTIDMPKLTPFCSRNYERWVRRRCCLAPFIDMPRRKPGSIFRGSEGLKNGSRLAPGRRACG